MNTFQYGVHERVSLQSVFMLFKTRSHGWTGAEVTAAHQSGAQSQRNGDDRSSVRRRCSGVDSDQIFETTLVCFQVLRRKILSVCVCHIMPVCFPHICVCVCMQIERFPCKKCSQLLPESEVETDGSR